MDEECLERNGLLGITHSVTAKICNFDLSKNRHKCNLLHTFLLLEKLRGATVANLGEPKALKFHILEELDTNAFVWFLRSLRKFVALISSIVLEASEVDD